VNPWTIIGWIVLYFIIITLFKPLLDKIWKAFAPLIAVLLGFLVLYWLYLWSPWAPICAIILGLLVWQGERVSAALAPINAVIERWDSPDVFKADKERPRRRVRVMPETLLALMVCIGVVVIGLVAAFASPEATKLTTAPAAESNAHRN
jgi:hypothetical protein